ncbi:Reverse transcriptase (RNA-dependent DNA polymerase) [Fragilaria crotonensis]|nr:Reverse transcriptase (RNA-dependent DNA polymerase) [Fragilaria crotonensis]
MDNSRNNCWVTSVGSAEAGARVKQTEPYSPWSNSAESAIRELKKGVGRQMVRSRSPKRLWDHCLRGKQEREKFTESVNKALGDAFKYEDFVNDPELEDLGTPIYEPYSDGEDDDGLRFVPDIDEADDDTYDQYVGAQVSLPIGDKMMTATVRGRKRSSDGTLRGKANANPILDTRTYEVEFPHGEKTEVAANIIAQNMYSQCDSEGNQYLLLSGIVDHRKDASAIAKSDMWITRGSNRRMRQTTKGWRLCIEWKDGTTSWERLADVKESNPIEVAEYAVAHGIDSEAAFAWWVPYTLRRRNRIIAAVNKRYHKRTHKFGIEVPKTYEDCIRIDRENGNTLWQDAVRKKCQRSGWRLKSWRKGRTRRRRFKRCVAT